MSQLASDPQMQYDWWCTKQPAASWKCELCELHYKVYSITHTGSVDERWEHTHFLLQWALFFFLLECHFSAIIAVFVALILAKDVRKMWKRGRASEGRRPKYIFDSVEGKVPCFLASFTWFSHMYIHKEYQILYKQSLKSCSVGQILPRAIRVTIHCRHSNQATGLLLKFIADNNSRIVPYVLSSMSVNPTLIKVQCC